MKMRINITIEEFMLRDLDEMAKSYGIDRSSMISVLIAEKEGFRTDYFLNDTERGTGLISY